MNALLPNEFKLWIDAKLEDRKQHIILKRRFTVNVLPEFKAALVNSKSVSGNPTFGSSTLISEGRSNFLLLPPTRKRAKIEEMKEIELVENEEYFKEAQYLKEITELESKINEYKVIQIEDANIERLSVV